MKVRAIKTLIREADAFLVNAKGENDEFLRAMYIKSAIAFSWFGLEGFVNIALSDFLSIKSLKIHERAFIQEQNLRFNEGEFIIGGNKYYSTEDKLFFFLKRFGNYKINKNSAIWNQFQKLEEWRHALVHPKEGRSVAVFTIKHATEALAVAKTLISLVYKRVYKKTAFF